MAGEALVGLVILAVAVAIAWLLTRSARKGSKKKQMVCPDCRQLIPAESRICPKCGQQIHVCRTCSALVLTEDGKCEVCGEAVNHRPPAVCRCPRCNSPVPSDSRKCPNCGERYWSPLVEQGKQ